MQGNSEGLEKTRRSLTLYSPANLIGDSKTGIIYTLDGVIWLIVFVSFGSGLGQFIFGDNFLHLKIQV